MTDENGVKVVAGVPDLFFAARIGETARQLGVAIEFASSGQAVLEKASRTPALVILDLGAAALEPIALIAKLKADPALRGARVVGFVNHERTDLIEQARQAGCDEVLTRGAFTKGLPGLLTEAGSKQS
jgi:CheY-like chemotaxis protein